MFSESHIVFLSYEQTSYKRKATVVLRSIFDEIEKYLTSGCKRDDVFQALISDPYNLDMTKGTFINALHRIRKERSEGNTNNENPSISERGVMRGEVNEVTPSPSASSTEGRKPNKFAGIKQKDNVDFKHKPAPNLDELLGGNKE